MLEVRGLRVAYGEVTALWGVSFDVRRGGDRGPGGRQRGRQDHDAEDALGPPPPEGGRGAPRRCGARDALPTSEIVARGLVHVPEGRKLFPEMTVVDNLLLGGFSRRRGRTRRSGSRRSSRASRACASGAAARRHALRRRAADGRHRTRPHGGPENPHDGRAVTRPRADHGGRDVPGHREHPSRRGDGAPRRAEHGARARHRPSRLRAGIGPGRPGRHRRRAARRRARARGYLGL